VSFMKLYSDFETWYVVDGPTGGATIPAYAVGVGAGRAPFYPATRVVAKTDEFAKLCNALTDFYEGDAAKLFSIEVTRGWCARYSAPGYLDCTDWCGPYSTEDEAIEECRALYGDAENDDDEGTEE
jgi:hypothetical protein